MKYAIISDIHSNIEALTACFKVIDAEKPDLVLCLGDIVGYGANPNECIDLVRARAAHVVVGNHDAAAIGTTETGYFNPDARAAVEWTRAALTAENEAYLRGLPATIRLQGILLVHASPSAPLDWLYVFNLREAVHEFTTFGERVCFVGHSHFPGFFIERERCHAQQSPPALAIGPGERAIVNVGSVGQPRDGDARAAFAFYDDATGRAEIRRVFYDVEQVRGRILAEAALPKSAAERLVWGV
jgi:diadenosine tetraphosphatase ApaH/serine/threonine PP2A family protein phosphatase